MRKDYEKLLSYIEPIEPPSKLFEKVLLSIKREQELRKARKMAFSFLCLFSVSFAAMPFSFLALASQIKRSGLFYFVSTAVSDFGMFFSFWQEFSLAILEALPVAEMTVFTATLGISAFTLRFFLRKKELLIGYLKHTSA